MFDSINQSVNTPKRDLLSIVANVPPGSLNGCKWCSRTILWNGGTWVHVDDHHPCRYVPCATQWVEGKTKPVEVRGIFSTMTRQAPVWRCTRCAVEDAAFLSHVSGAWLAAGSSNCKAAVATPANPEVR